MQGITSIVALLRKPAFSYIAFIRNNFSITLTIVEACYNISSVKDKFLENAFGQSDQSGTDCT
jgi:hypothetical protein